MPAAEGTLSRAHASRDNEHNVAQAQLQGQLMGPSAFTQQLLFFPNSSYNFRFGEGKRQEEAKERGVENGLWRAPLRPQLISDFLFSTDLYSPWVLTGVPCQAIHVSGSWVFVCSPLLQPLFFFFFLEQSYLTVQPTAVHQDSCWSCLEYQTLCVILLQQSWLVTPFSSYLARWNPRWLQLVSKHLLNSQSLKAYCVHGIVEKGIKIGIVGDAMYNQIEGIRQVPK